MRPPIQPPFQGFPPMADHRPPIADLLGLGRAPRGTTRRRGRTVTAPDEDARRRPEPCGDGISGAVGPEVERPMALHVDQPGAIGASPTHRPILPATDGRRRHGRLRQLVHEPPQGIGASGPLACGAPPGPGVAATREPEWRPRWGPAHGPRRCGRPDRRQACSDGWRRASGVHATNTTDVQDSTHGRLPERKVARVARVVARDARRRCPPARATDHGRGATCGHREDTVTLAHRGDLAPRSRQSRRGSHEGATPNSG